MKDALRLQFRHARDALPGPVRASASLRIADSTASCQEWRDADTVLLYASFGSEVDTGPLKAMAWNEAKTVVLPRVVGTALELHAVESATALTPNRWGIPEPSERTPVVPPQDIDAIVVPGLAFDRRGGRLGYGGGYYDRLLHAVPRARRIGVAFAAQIVERLPTTHLDAPMDILVTEDGICPLPLRHH